MSNLLTIFSCRNKFDNRNCMKNSESMTIKQNNLWNVTENIVEKVSKDTGIEADLTPIFE